MNILIACEFSGIVREAFKKKGHYVKSCDLLPSEIPGNHYQGDVMDIINDGWDLMIAHPPCTYLTTTGNKWFGEKYKDRFPTRHQDREDAVNFFLSLSTVSINKICIENPSGIISTRWRKPDQTIQPYQFGHKEAKRTCLWLKNLPLLKYTKIVEPEYTVFKSGKRMATWYVNAVNLPKEERMKVRSKTFQGIADAMAEQWGTVITSTTQE